MVTNSMFILIVVSEVYNVTEDVKTLQAATDHWRFLLIWLCFHELMKIFTLTSWNLFFRNLQARPLLQTYILWSKLLDREVACSVPRYGFWCCVVATDVGNSRRLTVQKILICFLSNFDYPFDFKYIKRNIYLTMYVFFKNI